MLECSVVIFSKNDAMVLLHSRLLSSRDLDNDIMSLMVNFCQVDNQFLKTSQHNEEMITFLSPSHHIEGEEVLNL